MRPKYRKGQEDLVSYGAVNLILVPERSWSSSSAITGRCTTAKGSGPANRGLEKANLVWST